MYFNNDMADLFISYLVFIEDLNYMFAPLNLGYSY